MTKPYNNITDMPYAKWLEQILHDITDIPMRAISIAAITENGDFYSNYYKATMADKLVLSGVINQDAMLDTLAANGVVEYEDEEYEEDDEEYVSDG